MPAGPSEFGFVYFAATKFVGYSAFCHWVIRPSIIDSKSFKPSVKSLLFSDSLQPTPPSLFAGGIRTSIGVVIGVIVGLGFWKIPAFETHSTLATSLFFLLLVPLRVGEWWLLLKTVYRNLPWQHAQLKIVLLGILASFALDATGIIAAFILPGGMWVC